MEVVLIRHTPCAVAEGVCYGHLDVALRDTAAQDIAATLRNVPKVELIFSSPSQRCRSLTQALADRDRCSIVIDEDLRELSFGSWEGVRWDAIDRSLSDPWSEDPWRRAPPEGESESQLNIRIERAYRRIQCSEARRIAVVSHGGPLRLLRCLLLGLPPTERWNWRPACGEAGRFTVPPESTGRFSDL